MADQRLTGGGGEKPCSPIMPAVAYTPHLLYCPLQLWVVNLAASLVVGLVAGMMTVGGVRVEATMLTFVVLHLYFAMRYRRDRHIWSVLTAKMVDGDPFPTWPHMLRGTRNLRRRGGANHFH